MYDHLPQNLRFGIYARKSLSNEDRQSMSIESQLNEVRAFAEKENIKVVKVYEDAGSAHIPQNRPNFTKMLKDIEEGTIDGILTWKADRIARNMIEAGVVIHMLQTNVIQIIRTPFSIHVPTDNMLGLVVEMGMANQFSLDLSRTVKRGIKTKVEKGGFCSKAPFGYKNCKDTRTVIKDPKNFEKVKQIFRLYLTERYSLQKLSDMCAGELDVLATITKKPLSKTSIHNILHNPFYAGRVYAKDIEQQGVHEAMITMDEHYKIKSMHKTTTKQGNNSRANEFLYAGLMSCGGCGSRVTAQDKVKYRCPNCNRKHNSKREKQCACRTLLTKEIIESGTRMVYYNCYKQSTDDCGGYINERDIDPQFETFLESLEVNKTFVAWARRWITFLDEEIKERDRKKVGSIKRAVKHLEKKLDRLMDMRLEGEVLPKEFRKQRDVLEIEKTELHGQLSDIESTQAFIMDEIEFLHGLKITYTNSSLEGKKAIFQKLDGHFELHSGKVHIQAKKAYVILQKIKLFYNRKKGDLEPQKNRSRSGFNASEDDLCSIWYAFVCSITKDL